MYRGFFKRLFDVTISLVALPFIAILLLIFAPIIYFSDKGPIFYASNRLGRHGKTFRIIKLRSMYINSPDIRNADGSTYNSSDDPRVTKIGRFLRKTSIDELPQFINVVRGDMSIIGPRPDLPDHFDTYTYEEKQKLSVRPGITGYSQAYFRNSVDLKARLKNDIHYVNNLSFGLDFKILFSTIPAVLKSKGVHTSALTHVEDLALSEISELSELVEPEISKMESEMETESVSVMEIEDLVLVENEEYEGSLAGGDNESP